ncbi:AraC family transcriptional regulator [Sporolactobacillus shoreae]|uniref:AraC family transcriptional regulator n=2 Tax=Sporolactobacillus shoreae TaxID=1465501 RepID=A0A4Z0GN74_9BACL|nr:AraC family transcriptional regulator [Sporolactobacillus shoreae]
MVHYSVENFMTNQQFPFYISIDEYRNGEISGEHDHDFSEIIYVGGGKGTHQYDKTTRKIRKGDLFIIQPGMVHGYSADRGSCLRLYRIMFDQHLLSGEWSTLNHASSYIDPIFIDPAYSGNKQFSSHISLTNKEQIELTLLLDRMNGEFQQKPWGYHCMIRMQLMEIFLYLGRWSMETREETVNPATAKIEMLNNVCSFIKQHYMEPITLEQVCGMSGMSQSAFTMNFKKVTGTSFIDYRNKVRIQAAKELLESTAYTIIIVAQRVGFEDLSNFDRTFKRIEGVSPLSYRKTISDK